MFYFDADKENYYLKNNYLFYHNIHFIFFISFSLTQVVNLLFCSVIFVSFGLNAYVPFKLIWETYLSKQLKSSSCLIAWEYLLRFIIVGTAGK